MPKKWFQKLKEGLYALKQPHPLRRLSPTRMIVLGFCTIILAGTLLLKLPISTRPGQQTCFLDALFTAASATCVTGLVRFDTYTHWTLFGQLIILIMIQISGIGFASIAMWFAALAKRNISLGQRLLMQEAVAAPELDGMVRITRLILVGTFLFEAAGAVLLSFYFCPLLGIWKGIYFGIFHSVSAFCNAGFDLMGAVAPDSSLISVSGNLYVNLVIIALIIIGGLGFLVWADIRQSKFRFRRFRLHTQVVLTVTALLIALGTILIFLFEQGGTMFADKGVGEQWLVSLFQSVTFRTAGYATVPLSEMTPQSKVVSILLMLIGGSPGSTAGGMKTTTFAVLICSVYATFRQRKSVELFRRRINGDVLQTVVSIAVFYIGISLCSALVISGLEGTSFMTAMFETSSAIATVGSSLGLTGNLGKVSESILIFLMLIGRVGSVTFLLMFSSRERESKSQYPLGKIQVG